MKVSQRFRPMVAASLLLCTPGFYLRGRPPLHQPRCAGVACVAPPVWAEFNCGTWVGSALLIDPLSAKPHLPYKRTRVTVSAPTEEGVVEVRSSIGDQLHEEAEQRAVDSLSLVDVDLDVDIDGKMPPRPSLPSRHASSISLFYLPPSVRPPSLPSIVLIPPALISLAHFPSFVSNPFPAS